MDVLFGQAYDAWQSWGGGSAQTPVVSPSSSSSEDYYDPEAVKLQSTVSFFTTLVEQQAALLQNPDYLRYLSGSWKLFPTPKGEKSGEYCSAFFSKVSMDPAANDAAVIITLSGPGGDYAGALLGFATEAIPRPETMQTIQVNLTQNDEPTVTVQAFNYAMPNMPFGMIAFPVPTIDAALAGMEDTQHFNVEINGKSVAKTFWHSGLQVRDEFRKCLNGEPYGVTDIDLLPERMKQKL
jgi:hypothetical protein